MAHYEIIIETHGDGLGYRADVAEGAKFIYPRRATAGTADGAARTLEREIRDTFLSHTFEFLHVHAT